MRNHNEDSAVGTEVEVSERRKQTGTVGMFAACSGACRAFSLACVYLLQAAKFPLFISIFRAK